MEIDVESEVQPSEGTSVSECIKLDGSFGQLKDFLPKKKAAPKPGDESLREGGVRARLKAAPPPVEDSSGILQDSSEHLSFLTQLLARSQAKRGYEDVQVARQEREVELSELNHNAENPETVERIPLISSESAKVIEEDPAEIEPPPSSNTTFSWLRSLTCRCLF
uniref:Uncharacterized protein n=1 Tax=Guillardia theta TaxID=55529 RepID=A0A7S4PI24_GUITH|mmetsp:Transcript_51147/g.159793  ORF Transcript_51147/g.159793 Transcript_51147/m.159793 type:complete len:165 (+) Transcript_51147:129-623(+)